MPKKTYSLKDFSGGMNLKNHTTALEDNEAYSMENFSSEGKGSLQLGAKMTRAALGGLEKNVFIPGEGLNIGLSDHIYKDHGSISDVEDPSNLIKREPSNFDTSYVGSDYWVKGANGSTETEAVTIVAGEGILYQEGGAHFQKHYVRTGNNLRFIRSGNWYQFYIIMHNVTRTDTGAWPGHLELFLGPDPTDSATVPGPMRPAEYVNTHNIAVSGGGAGGIYIRPGHASNADNFSAVTTQTLDKYCAIASGICQAPIFDDSSNQGYVWLFGHPNGTTTSGTQDWHVAHVQIRHLVQDKDYGSATANDKGEIFLSGGDQIKRFNGDAFVAEDYFDSKKSDYSASSSSVRTNAANSAVSTKPDLYQGDSLYRLSDGNFDNETTAQITGPIVKDVADILPVATEESTTTFRGQYTPQTRRYLHSDMNINSVWKRLSINNQFPLSGSTNEVGSTAKEVDQAFLAANFGSVSLSVRDPGAGDPATDSWQSVWKFGISYRLMDNSTTKVFTGYEHKGWHSNQGWTAPPLKAVIADPGYEAVKTDGTHTGKTIDVLNTDAGSDVNVLQTGGASSDTGVTYTITGCTLYVKNHALVGIELPDDNDATNFATSGTGIFPGNGVKFEVDISEFPVDSGSCSVKSTGYLLQRNGNSGVLNDTIDLTSFAFNPTLHLAFRYNSLDKGILTSATKLAGSVGNPYGDYINNQYDDKWDKTGRISGMFDDTWDPRINGFTIWALDVNAESPDGATPWIPVYEVDLDDKTFIPLTHDKVKRDLVRDDKYNFNLFFNACYHVGDEFTLNGGTQHASSPDVEGSGSLALTYSEFIGHRDDINHDVKWKCSTICNNRAIIGNISRAGVHYPDRIAVSHYNTFDTFPGGFIGSGDVSINDGEDIVELASYGSKILVFKKKTVLLVDFTDPDNWAVIGTFRFMGTPFKGMVVENDYGISWVSPYSGVQHFDGQELKELTKDILNYDDLGSGLTNGTLDPAVQSLLSYDNLTKKLFLRVDCSTNNHASAGNKSLDYWVYSFKEHHWVLAKNGTPHSSQAATTNFINTLDNTLIAYNTVSTGATFPSNDSSNTDSFLTINPVLTYQPSSTRVATYRSKEIDFGIPGQLKKVYKVYIKYKSGRNGSGTNGGYTVSAMTNGNYSTGLAFSASGDGTILTDNSGNWVIHTLTPNIEAQFTDINTIAIRFISVSHTETGTAFEVDSINIIYRTKPIK